MKTALAILLAASFSSAAMAACDNTAADTNLDGKVSPAEAQEATARMFTALDADKDGKISLAEWRECSGYYESAPATGSVTSSSSSASSSRDGTVTATTQLTLNPADLDTNRNGSIERVEIAQIVQGGLGAKAESGAISGAERAEVSGQKVQARAYAAWFIAHDADLNGTVTDAEWKGDPASGGEMLFTRMDNDKDAAVSNADWQIRMNEQFDKAMQGGGEISIATWYLYR